MPAKVNLHLSVGEVRKDGKHELVTVYQAVSLYDEVTGEPDEYLLSQVFRFCAILNPPEEIRSQRPSETAVEILPSGAAVVGLRHDIPWIMIGQSPPSPKQTFL